MSDQTFNAEVVDAIFNERDQLKAENAKLRELFNETLIRLAAANEAADGGFMDARYCELLESYGIEVGEWANVSTSST